MSSSSSSYSIELSVFSSTDAGDFVADRERRSTSSASSLPNMIMRLLLLLHAEKLTESPAECRQGRAQQAPIRPLWASPTSQPTWVACVTRCHLQERLCFEMHFCGQCSSTKSMRTEASGEEILCSTESDSAFKCQSCQSSPACTPCQQHYTVALTSFLVEQRIDVVLGRCGEFVWYMLRESVLRQSVLVVGV